MIIESAKPRLAAPLFEGWQESIIWSCLQQVMGNIYVNSSEYPVSAMALLGDFCFLAGKPDEELVRFKPRRDAKEFMIMVPQHEAWGEMIQTCCGEKAKRVIRYAMKKEPDVFDRESLWRAVGNLPKGYVMQQIDEALFYRLREISWCRDLVSVYDSYGLYAKHGLGVAIFKDGEPVSGASSYSGYLGGIEVEIDTKEEYRRKGLAYICGAKLILECLDRGWYPSWDAQNPWSVALAEKLGYHFDYEYTAYEICGY